MKKLPYHIKFLKITYKIIFIIFSISIFFNYGCVDDSQSYKISTSGSEESTPIKSIKIYLETSISMKGYVNADVAGDYQLPLIVPTLITDCDVKFDTTYLFTICDRPRTYTNTRNEFRDALISGNIFTGSSSILDNIFIQIIDSTQKNEVSMLISDCILDLGSGQTMASRSYITTDLYDVLSKHKHISAAVFQYYSDFNGDWYYDRNNYPKPFVSEIMQNRPFYIWIFGSSSSIKQIFEKNTFKNYKNIYTYGINYKEITCKLLKYPKDGRISITDNENIKIIEVSDELPVTFTIGLDLSLFPEYCKEQNYLSNNLEIDSDFFAPNIEVFDIEDIKKTLSKREFEDIRPVISQFGLTRFVKLTFDNMPDSVFKLILQKKEPKWINNAEIDDDLCKSIEELEKKTFSFTYLTNAFNDKYEGENIFEINFTLINNKTKK